MGSEAAAVEAVALRDYLHVIRRRKWILILAVVFVPLAALVFSLLQQRLYEASADVLLPRQNLAATLTNVPDPAVHQQPERFAATQRDLARVPEVAARALAAANIDAPPRDLLAFSSVDMTANSDLLKFSVRAPSAELAIKLATAYAGEFTKYRHELDTARLERARTQVKEDLAELEAAGNQKSPLYSSLVDKEQQLRTMEALLTEPVLVRAADEANQVQPRPLRNAIVGLALGLVLGIGLAFLWEALDTRVRRAEEVSEHLGLPLLARIPAPPRKVASANDLVMLAEPNGTHAEPFRMLRTNLDFVSMERGARAVIVTSALEAEGKSTTAANLAIAVARSGRRVALVDLDLRRPFLDRFFDANGRPGLTNVALGHAELDEALTPVALTNAPADGTANRTTAAQAGNGNGHLHVEGLLEVLPSGPVPPDPGEFIGTRAVATIVDQLRQRADLVIIDAPPLLHVGDAIALSDKVDALVVVARLKMLRRPILKELRRVLDAAPAAKLGFVATGAEAEEAHGYGGYYRYGSYAPVEKTGVA